MKQANKNSDNVVQIQKRIDKNNINQSKEKQDKNVNITVLSKYNQSTFPFIELPAKYRSLIEFDTALMQEHYQKKESWQDNHAFLHEPYFEWL